MKIITWLLILFPALALAGEDQVVSLRAINDDYRRFSGTIVVVEGSLLYGFESAQFTDTSIPGREFPVWFDWDPIAIRRSSGEGADRFLTLVDYQGVANSRGGWRIASGRFRVFVQISERRMKMRTSKEPYSGNDMLSGYGHMNQSDALFTIVEVLQIDPDKVVMGLAEKAAQPGATDNPGDAH